MKKTRPERSQEPETQDSATAETATPEAGARGNGGVEAATNAEALAAITKANEAILQGMAEMQREILEFAGVRLREDLNIQDALSQCADPREAFQAQADFTQKAMQHYAEETSKLMALSARIGRECWGPFEDATRAALKEMTPR